MTNIHVISLLWAVLCCGSTLAKHYTPQWAVHIEGGDEVAENIASKHGFINRGKIFTDMYHFEHRAVMRRSIQPSQEHHERLSREPQVRWARQQVVKSRQKRDYTQQQQGSSRPRSIRNLLNDPRWPQMWYLNRGNGLDMNVQSAWSVEGVTGRGVVVTILDDGLEKDHPDLMDNYDPQASYDVNNHDEDPMPRYDLIDSNRHGTRCAGEVAAVANNSICAVGIAYRASVGGVRMLDGDVTDAVEARSLSLNPQHIDIYSASWGPDDDGKTVDGPGELATRAFVEGVNKGRGGKGSIFIWASGNGGRDHDNCNCDGYTNSIWTLSISSATENGLVPWYSEACSSTLATTYSSGAAGERQVVTTDLHHQCTTSHTGTSASAPLAAGICALALEANRQLTWRDMQHIVVRTARPQNLVSSDWRLNGVGRNVSHSFGYGLMDAAAMVRLARKWRTVPEQHKCEVSSSQLEKLIPSKSQVVLQLDVEDCPHVNYLEHVQAKMTLHANRRGDIQIHLTSPAGTRSTLLARRPHDISRAGFTSWPFMTVHNWGERPFGKWLLEIHNEGRFLGNLTGWKLILHGTETEPNGEDDGGDVGIILGPPPIPEVSNNISTRYSSTSSAKPKSKQQPVMAENMPVDMTVNSRPWHEDEPYQRNGVERTTTEDVSSGTGCVVLARSGHQCIECEESLFLFDSGCVRQCPPRTHIGLSPKGRSACLRCHYSCLSCSGPNIDQCLVCSPDAFLQPTGLCLPLAIDPLIQANHWYFWMFVAFSLNLATLVIITSYVTLTWMRQSQKKHHYHIVQQEAGAVHMNTVNCVSESSDEEN